MGALRSVILLICHLSSLSAHLTVIIAKVCSRHCSSSHENPKILQTFISSQLTTWFRHKFPKVLHLSPPSGANMTTAE